MKSILKYSFISTVLLAAVWMTSCSEWTDPESLRIGHQSLDEQNPELYAEYLQNLRDYRGSDHKVVYGIFDNGNKLPTSRAHNLTAIPDSVDIVSLLYPDNLTTQELDEIATIRGDKGMKVIYTISYPDIEKAYSDLPEPGEGEQQVDFLTYMTASVDRSIALCDKYGYDGISFLYNGLSTLNMTETQLADYKATQEALLAKIDAWRAAHSGKILLYEGRPQYLLDKSILPYCRYIVLRTHNDQSAGALNYAAHQACAENVPTDRFIVSAQPFSLDAADTSTGHFSDIEGNDARAVTEVAYWVATPSTQNYTKAGMAIVNIQNDYYNASLIYQYSRGAIRIMNPAANN